MSAARGVSIPTRDWCRRRATTALLAHGLFEYPRLRLPARASLTSTSYTGDGWHVRETSLNLDHLAQSESIFALSYGHIGPRGNLDEGELHGLPGTYLNSVCELRPLPYAEVAYGNPESGQTVIDVTNGKLIRLLVNDEPFDVRYGERPRHERELDLQAGLVSGVAGGGCTDARAMERPGKQRNVKPGTQHARHWQHRSRR